MATSESISVAVVWRIGVGDDSDHIVEELELSMDEVWDQRKIQNYIDSEVEESLTLDYKRAASLGKQNNKKDEVTKDVSAMANSAGGLVIYGLAEYDAEDKKHLPEKIDPVDRTEFTKEWLEQVINNIRPRIDKVIVHPISIDTAFNHVVYVVEIPQSTTAHQASDKRYYKRFNTLSVAMEDYEIRDVLNRAQYPRIELEFYFTRKKDYFTLLHIVARNTGSVLAQYINVFVEIPKKIVSDLLIGRRDLLDGDKYLWTITNTVQDVVDTKTNPYGTTNIHGPKRYVPLLPKLTREWSQELNSDFEPVSFSDQYLNWSIHADNAPMVEGQILIRDILIKDSSDTSYKLRNSS